MKKDITIKSMTLNHFKGLKKFHIDFENQTDVYGANGTGKTTISDAFTWLLFGKDSQDRKDFEVKTIDVLGNVIPKVEHEVSAVLLVDGQEVSIKRVLKENWVKKRGSLEAEFSGNVTDLYWNDVPMTLTDFNKKVNEVLNEQVFKMITSPNYFNSIDWKQRRSILIDIAGQVSDEELAAGNPAYQTLIANLTQGKTMDDYKAQIAASVKKAKEDLKAIPTRIDEVERGRPEAQDFRVLEIELEAYGKELEKVEADLADVNKAFQTKLDDVKGVKININNLEVEITNIESEARREAKQRLTPDTSVLDRLTKDLADKNHEVTSYQNMVNTLEQKKNGIVSQIESLEKQIIAKRSEWENENAKKLVFSDGDCKCPTCQREYDAADLEAKKETMLTSFKADKIAQLNAISAQGKNLATEKTNLETEVATLSTRIENGKKEIESSQKKIEEIKAEIASLNNVSTADMPSEQSVYEGILALHPTYEAKKAALQTLKDSVVEVPAVDNTELVSRRNDINRLIDETKAKLQTKTQIEAIERRISELKDEERKLAQQVADVEKIQFTIESFIKDKIDRLETAINSKFKFVQFKMFDQQINGGLRETCEAVVNGVPYSDVNTASKINAGLDIINTLCEFYGVTAPIFIDNAESVHTLIDTDSQLIRLVVSEFHKQLEVKSKELVA